MEPYLEELQHKNLPLRCGNGMGPHSKDPQPKKLFLRCGHGMLNTKIFLRCGNGMAPHSEEPQHQALLLRCGNGMEPHAEEPQHKNNLLVLWKWNGTSLARRNLNPRVCPCVVEMEWSLTRRNLNTRMCSCVVEMEWNLTGRNLNARIIFLCCGSGMEPHSEEPQHKNNLLVLWKWNGTSRGGTSTQE